MCRSNTEIIDAIYVAKLVGTGCTSEINPGCSFPTDPIATYRSEGAFLHYFNASFLVYLSFIEVKDNLI